MAQTTPRLAAALGTLGNFFRKTFSRLQISGKNCQALSQLLILQKVLVKLKNIHDMTVGGRVGALWIGGLEPYMDESFLQVT